MTQHAQKIKAVTLHRFDQSATFPVSSDADAASFVLEMMQDRFRAYYEGNVVHLFAPDDMELPSGEQLAKRNQNGPKAPKMATSQVPNGTGHVPMERNPGLRGPALRLVVGGAA